MQQSRGTRAARCVGWALCGSMACASASCSDGASEAPGASATAGASGGVDAGGPWAPPNDGGAGASASGAGAVDAGPDAGDTISIETEQTLRRVLSAERLGVSDGDPIALWVERLREHVAGRSPARLYGADASPDPVTQANEILASGWVLRGHPPLSITPPLPWDLVQNGDSNWHYSINAMHPLTEIMLAYEQTGDRTYLDAARAAMLDWIDFNLTRNQPNSRKWHDMSTGYRAEKLAFIIDEALRDGTTRAVEIALWLDAALAHTEVLADPARLPDGNHAVFMMLGLAGLCETLPELAQCDTRGRYADDTLSAILKSQFFLDEAVHLEGSPGYHLFMASRLDWLKQTGLFDANATLTQLAESAPRRVPLMFHPNGDPVLIGDSGLVALEDYAAQSAEARYVLSEGSEGTAPPSDIAFPKTGYAIMRSPWTQTPFAQHSFLFFSAAWHDGPHNHLDHFTFEWSERGQPIIVDSGKYTYDKGPERDFFVSTRAGNSLVIDGRDLKRVAALSSLRSFGSVGSLHFVDAVATRAGSIEHTRALVLAMGQWLAIIDRLRAPASHEYTEWLHFHEAAAVALGDTPGSASLTWPTGGPDVFVQSVGSGGTPTAELDKGETGDRIQGWLSRDYQQQVPRYSLGITHAGGDVDIVTLLALDAPPEGLTATDTDGALNVSWQRAGASEGFSYRVDAGQAVVELP